MELNNKIKSWPEAAARLIAVAAGREPADLVIKGGKWVNVHSREVLEGHDIAVAEGRFAAIAPDLSSAIGPDTEVIEANGRYMVPGLCDAHMHIESGMLTPAEFAAAVIPHGTTSMFTDPHEIANVLGLEGVKMMHDEALMQPVNIFTQMPSCAPSAPGLETTGFEITPEDVAAAMQWPGIVGLGEMMNFPGVVAGDPKMLAEIAATQNSGKTVGGHYASPDLGAAFRAYVAGGPADDHEGTCEADAIARVRQGMRSMMRLGSAWYDVETQITAVTEKGLDPRNFILCTDDCHSGTLIHEGHMNRVYRHAVACGAEPLVALQMCTINTATHFGLERELGSITPGRRADLILTSDLATLPVEQVIARGKTVAKDGKLLVECPHYDWPDSARNTVHLGKTLNASDFEISAPEGANTVTARVIGVVENQAPTKALTAELDVTDGLAQPDTAKDIAQIALVERLGGRCRDREPAHQRQSHGVVDLHHRQPQRRARDIELVRAIRFDVTGKSVVDRIAERPRPGGDLAQTKALPRHHQLLDPQRLGRDPDRQARRHLVNEIGMKPAQRLAHGGAFGDEKDAIHRRVEMIQRP